MLRVTQHALPSITKASVHRSASYEKGCFPTQYWPCDLKTEADTSTRGEGQVNIGHPVA